MYLVSTGLWNLLISLWLGNMSTNACSHPTKTCKSVIVHAGNWYLSMCFVVSGVCHGSRKPVLTCLPVFLVWNTFFWETVKMLGCIFSFYFIFSRHFTFSCERNEEIVPIIYFLQKPLVLNLKLWCLSSMWRSNLPKKHRKF